MTMNTFRLGVRDSADYAALFDETKAKIQPAIGGQRATPEMGVVTIGEGDLEFEVWLPSDRGSLPPAHVSTAKSVLGQIVRMDDEARAIPDIIDSDENLAWVAINDDGVEFHYFANSVSSEWSVLFAMDENGVWRCRGIKKPTSA
ncbi:MAG: hypothetical protein NT015_12470 [Alphaproteobacteria bacterium]|nr:hypothetical protein [Alphaproteobacteria bacterium]